MNLRHFLPVISLVILTILPFHRATAEGDSFLAALLRFTGITATPSTVRGNDSFKEGDIWLFDVLGASTSEPRKITKAGNYHTPLWLPGNQSILAMKGDKLVQLNAQGNEEKTLHTLTDSTVLLGFDKNDPNRVLVLQDSLAGVLILTNGQITPLPYDKGNPTNRFELDQLSSGFRDYGTSQVSIENQRKVDPKGHFRQVGTVHIRLGKKAISISCPSTCSQPALTADGRQLLFIGL
jgi:hypothetical protein